MQQFFPQLTFFTVVWTNMQMLDDLSPNHYILYVSAVE